MNLSLPIQLPRKADQATQTFMPVVHSAGDYVVLRQGLVVMVLEVIGPSIEWVSQERQEKVIAGWQEVLGHVRCSVSHHLIADERSDYQTERYFGARSKALRESGDLRPAVAARDWAQYLAHFRLTRYRSLLVCTRDLPSSVARADDQVVTLQAGLLREDSKQILAGIERLRWTARCLSGDEIESAVREVFDPFYRRGV